MLISLGEGGSKSKCTTLSQTQMFILSFCPIYIIGCFKRQFSSGLPILAFQGSQLENGLFPRNLELVCKTTSQYVKPQKYLLKPLEKFGNASSLLAKIPHCITCNKTARVPSLGVFFCFQTSVWQGMYMHRNPFDFFFDWIQILKSN